MRALPERMSAVVFCDGLNVAADFFEVLAEYVPGVNFLIALPFCMCLKNNSAPEESRRTKTGVGTMGKFPFILSAVGGAAVVIHSAGALAGAVSDADLRGKKICWNTGITSSYNKDGSFDSNRSGHGTWRLAGDQVVVSASNGAGASTITKDGNTFHITRRASKSGKDIEAWGSYCN